MLEGAAPELAAAYPRPGGDADGAAAWAVARRTFGAHRERVAAFMTHEPQTNEVRRSACLLGGFLEMAHATGLPLRCFEIAASAGLNLSWDQYRYELGSAAWGPEGAPVVIDAEWRGETPPVGAAVRVVERAACDRRPVVLSDPAERRRLLAYVWPDQFERVARIRAAIGLALANGVKVEAADAVDWAAARAKPTPGAASVLYHSIFWQYMPPDSQAALARVIADLGAQATADAPFAWVRMEPPPADMTIFELRMTLWPGGEDRRLGLVHPHGAWADWGA